MSEENSTIQISQTESHNDDFALALLKSEGIIKEESSPEAQPPATGEQPSDKSKEATTAEVVNTPAATENKPTGSEPSITDETKLRILNEMLGTSYNALSDIDGLNLKESIKEIPDLRRVKGEYEKISKTKPADFHNDTIRELNTFAKVTGIDDPTVLRKIKQIQSTDKPDPIEAMVVAQVSEDPTLIEKMDLLRKSLKKQYNITTEEDDNHDPENSELEQFRMERDGKAAVKKLTELMEKVKSSTPEVNTEAETKKLEQVRSTWRQTFDKAGPEIFSKAPIFIQNGNDESGKPKSEIATELQLSPEETKKYTDLAYSYAVEHNLEPSEENMKAAVISTIRDMYADNIHTIVKSAREKAVSEARLEWEKQAHNPSGNQRVETPTEKEPPKTPSEIAMEAAERYYRGE
jgi:hypothetical protein